MISDLLPLSLFVLVPAAILAFVSAKARRATFVAGLLVGLASEYVTGAGPDNPLTIIPLVGFGFSIAALIVEIGSLVFRRSKWLRNNKEGDHRPRTK